MKKHKYTKKTGRKSQQSSTAHNGLVNPDAAGVDIHPTSIFIAVPPGRDSSTVRQFETFTTDLLAAADWLTKCGIRTVAMESTGVYWIPFYQLLSDRGFEVCLVNARHAKNVPGRKTDVSDCQWLQYLHSVGLLRGSFRPPQEICAMRAISRHRDNLLKMGAVHTQHMQKALDQMNLHLHHVIDDITGVTGLAIIEAILAGERDAARLAKLRDRRIEASEETIMKALEGDYRREHLFVLRQSFDSWKGVKRQIAECDALCAWRHFRSIAVKARSEQSSEDDEANWARQVPSPPWLISSQELSGTLLLIKRPMTEPYSLMPKRNT